MLYDISKTFQENLKHGPYFCGDIPPRILPHKSEWINFLGYDIASPLGVSACPVTLGKGIALLSQLGFDVLTYKTIRSQPFEGHSFPNLVPVDIVNSMKARVLASPNHEFIAFANSIGNASHDVAWLRKDIAYARSCIQAGQVLIVSVYGEESSDRSVIEDFVYTAQFAESAGAQIIELNFSCPNVHTKKMIYKDPEMVFAIGSEVAKNISIPVIFKCGMFESKEHMKKVICSAAYAGLRGVSGINTQPMSVVDSEGNAVFGSEREIAGVSGAPLFNDALQFVSWASNIIKQEKLDMVVIGTGGIVKPSQFKKFLDAGVAVALTATGMMSNPYIAAECHAMNRLKSSIGCELLKTEAVRYGDFVLKSGVRSSSYVDMRRAISYPSLMKELAQALSSMLNEIECDYICGVPLAALPLAMAVSLDSSVPMIMCRPEAKDHGTKQKIEGVYKTGKRCVIIEDVVTSGGSILQTIADLEQAGLVVEDVIVVVDRQQGGREALESRGYALHSLFTLSELLTINERRENTALQKQVSYKQRGSVSSHPVARRLYDIIESKQTNLAVAADVTTVAELLKIAELLGPQICMLKVHIDIVKDFTQECVAALQDCAQRHNFILCEDRKFADIGNTVREQYIGGMYSIVEWADIVTVHALPGSGIIEALKREGLPKNKACVLLAQMSSDGNLLTSDYSQGAIRLAEDNPDFVIGLIAQEKLSNNQGMLHMTPGVQLNQGTDDLGQRYNTPAEVISRGSDVIIVGRGIIHADDPVAVAEQYRLAGWQSYCKRINV